MKTTREFTATVWKLDDLVQDAKDGIEEGSLSEAEQIKAIRAIEDSLNLFRPLGDSITPQTLKRDDATPDKLYLAHQLKFQEYVTWVNQQKDRLTTTRAGVHMEPMPQHEWRAVTPSVDAAHKLKSSLMDDERFADLVQSKIIKVEPQGNAVVIKGRIDAQAVLKRLGWCPTDFKLSSQNITPAQEPAVQATIVATI